MNEQTWSEQQVESLIRGFVEALVREASPATEESEKGAHS